MEARLTSTERPIIQVQHVSRAFHTAGTTVHAVRDVSLEVSRGEFVAIIGRSGSGKTTLLNLIAGLDTPDSGAVLVNSEDITGYTDEQVTAFRRHTIGFIFQSFGLLPLLSAAENIELVLRVAGTPMGDRRQRTDELLEQVGLGPRSGHRPYELSGGEQQRVAVARALANEPPILIADEPTGELDSATGEQIFTLLREIADSGVTVVTATHDPFVIDHVDRVVEMDDGAIADPATPRLSADDRADGRSHPDQADEPAEPTPAERAVAFVSGRISDHARMATLAAVLAITGLGAFLRLYDLDRVGLGNLFYASSIWSMGQSFHNAVYAAYDPAGTISVDKPPVALWLQVLSTKLFGYEGWAMVLPMAIAGIVAVPLVFFAGRRSYGSTGAIAVGLLAAAVLAVFPESVATSRDSTMDALVMALLAAGAWLLIVAVEDRRPWLLVAWTALMGIVFNVKFFEGFVILPAAVLYVGWRWRDDWRSLIRPAGVAIVVGFLVSLSWITVVELTPEDDRPLVMNDESNSAYGLAFRYNGLERVLPGDVAIFQPVGNAPASERLISVTNSFGVGTRGPFRLFEDTYGPLIGFTVILALFGAVLALWQRRDWVLRGPGLLWLAWLLTGTVLFSASNRAAAHYTESYTPAIAVLAAVGIVEGWRLGSRGNVIPLQLALIGVLAFARFRYDDFEALSTSTFLTVGAIGVVAALAPFVSLARRRQRFPIVRDVLRATSVTTVLGISLLTSLWITFDAPGGGQISRPNPLDYTRADEPPPLARQVPAEPMVAHANREAPGTRYAFATTDINDAGESIAYTGASTLPIWNEYQRVPVLEDDDLAARFASGEVPFVLVDVGRQRGGLLSEVMPIIEAHCSITAIQGASSRFYETWDCRPEAQ